MAGTAEKPVNDREPVLILGTGALAILFAARLSAKGTPVTLLGTWKDGLAALQRDGARLIIENGDKDGNELALPLHATDDPAACRGARLALVLVKAWQTERAAAQLNECLSADGLAMTLQNGLGNREILSRFLGASRVGLGVSTYGATLLGPGLARSGGEGTISVEEHPRLGTLAGILKNAGFRMESVPDARALVWGKLVISTAINPLTALLGVPNGVLLERPGARALMADLARETAVVAQSLGLQLPFADAVASVEQVARQTATNHSSMLQDVQRGAPTEIDAICGAVVRTAQEIGVPVPVNRVMWQLISAIASNLR
jgi:2-dehydropantoate 2-reductase